MKRWFVEQGQTSFSVDRMEHSFQAAGNGWLVEVAKHQHPDTDPDPHFVLQSGRQEKTMATGDG